MVKEDTAQKNNDKKIMACETPADERLRAIEEKELEIEKSLKKLESVALMIEEGRRQFSIEMDNGRAFIERKKDQLSKIKMSLSERQDFLNRLEKELQEKEMELADRYITLKDSIEEWRRKGVKVKIGVIGM